MAMEFYNEIIDITNQSDMDKDLWRPDQQYEGTYPEGARDKEVYFSPANPETGHIKPDWRYLFKLPRRRDWCPWQFWVEIIAYRLGCLIGVAVPPAHVGFNGCYSLDSGADIPVYGALIEWFYDDKKDIYIPGGQIMSQVIEDYDRVKGGQHNLESIMQSFKGVGYDHWAGVLTLDTLLADTDRHQDNWGLIVRKKEGRGIEAINFSPAFDNGTALEYSVQEENFHKYKHNAKL